MIQFSNNFIVKDKSRMPRTPSKKWFEEQRKGNYPRLSSFFESTPKPTPSHQVQNATPETSASPPENWIPRTPPSALTPESTPENTEMDLMIIKQPSMEIQTTTPSQEESPPVTYIDSSPTSSQESLTFFLPASQNSTSSLSDDDDLMTADLRFRAPPSLTRLQRCSDIAEEERTAPRNNSNWIQRVIATLKNHSQPIQTGEPHPFKTLAAQWVSTAECSTNGCGECELCDHTPITYHHKIINLKNDNQLWIGSECIQKFAEENLGLQQNGQVIHGVDAEAQIKENITAAQREVEEHRKKIRRFIR